MPKYSILLKINAIVFGSLPFVLIGLFSLLGGASGGPATNSPIKFIGMLLLLAGVFWALPSSTLLKVKAGIANILLFYFLPGAFAALFFVWLIFSTETPSFFLSSLLGLFVLAGIGSAAFYHLKVCKTEEDWEYIKAK